MIYIEVTRKESMQKIRYYFEKYKLIIVITIIVMVIISFFILLIKDKYNTVEEEIVTDIEKNDTINLIKVEIKGLVKNPGVYEISENSRVIDVINKAGGLLEDASTQNLNLSKKIVDEDVIIVNSKEMEESNLNDYVNSNTNTSINTQNKNVSDGLISINNATIEELETLPQVGEKKAIAIIEYRNQNGPFKSLDEIMNVSGIGDKIYSKIKDYIKL